MGTVCPQDVVNPTGLPSKLSSSVGLGPRSLGFKCPAQPYSSWRDLQASLCVSNYLTLQGCCRITSRGKPMYVQISWAVWQGFPTVIPLIILQGRRTEQIHCSSNSQDDYLDDLMSVKGFGHFKKSPSMCQDNNNYRVRFCFECR